MADATQPLPPAGDLLRRSFSGLGSAWATMLGLVVAGVALCALAVFLVFGFAFGILAVARGEEVMQRIQANPDALKDMLEDPTMGLLFMLLYVLAILVVIRIWCTFALALMHVAAAPTIGFRASLRLAKRRSLGFIGMLILQQIAVSIALLALILPGIWLAIRLNMAPLALAREDAGAVDSLKRSFEMTGGRFWAVLGRLLLIGIVGGLISIVPIVGWVVGPCVQLLGIGQLYHDLGGRDLV
jgi:hypothetical protein